MTRLPRNRPAAHPGEMLLKEFLKPLGVTPTAFAERIRVPNVRLNSIVEGHPRVTPDLALLLVVKAGSYCRIDAMHAIRRELRGLRAAVDLVVATPEELVDHGSNPALVYWSALRTGRELYAL